ncbi:hypothetical protein [Hydrotalea sp.]|uniref:hypothetical protein n=1 Tax=Hydrotalea sp. TaxID=2881279 RepID=UPI002638D390|nr:hypothetical protein [Hydrotalea sp.]
MKKIFTIFILFFLFSACKKETVITPTSADQISSEILNVIKSNYVKRVICWSDNTGFPGTPIQINYGKSWNIENGFISISGNYDVYNLLYLDRYDINNITVVDGSTPITLFLHFK